MSEALAALALVIARQEMEISRLRQRVAHLEAEVATHIDAADGVE